MKFKDNPVLLSKSFFIIQNNEGEKNSNGLANLVDHDASRNSGVTKDLNQNYYQNENQKL